MTNKKDAIELIEQNGGEITPIQDEAEKLIAMAIEKNVPVESLERLLALRDKLRAEKAEEAFDRAMANFQAKCPTIEKRKKGYNYKYADLTDIVEQIKELLAENGFSYTFDTDEAENAVIVYCKIKHIAGHKETSKAKISNESTSKMNASQQSGASMTYGKRYALCNALGILTGDEDTDAATPKQKQHFDNSDGALDNGREFEHHITQHKAVEEKDKNSGGSDVTEKQVSFIQRLLKQKGHTEKALEIKYKVSNIYDLTSKQASTIIENLLKLDDVIIH